MAFLINYSDPITGMQCSAAYLKINRVQLSKSDQSASIEAGIYASEVARKAGLQPISMQTFVCDRSMPFGGGVDVSPTSTLYEAYFGSAQIADPVNPAPATNLDDILISQAYLALQALPQAAILLANATIV